MKRLLTTGLLAVAVVTGTSTPAMADPGAANPQVQYRTFSCDNGATYDVAFVGPSASFLIQGSTSIFAIKVFTEYFPSGEVKTFNFGVAGFEPSSLLTCSYTDPQGVLNVFSGFITPRV